MPADRFSSKSEACDWFEFVQVRPGRSPSWLGIVQLVPTFARRWATRGGGVIMLLPQASVWSTAPRAAGRRVSCRCETRSTSSASLRRTTTATWAWASLGCVRGSPYVGGSEKRPRIEKRGSQPQRGAGSGRNVGLCGTPVAAPAPYSETSAASHATRPGT